MKSKTYKPILLLLFICVSCNTETKLSFTETQITTDTNSIVSINIPKANETTDASNNINDAISQTIVSALNFGESDTSSNTIEQQIDLFNNEFNAFKNDFPDSAQQWEAQIDGDIMYQSQEIISIALTSYINTGGAHGISTITILNFNTDNGLQLKNHDLFSNIKAVKDVARPYFDDITKEKEDVNIDPENFNLPENIGFSEDGVLMLYNVYEVASYASGIIQFTIPYSDISSYLNYH